MTFSKFEKYAAGKINEHSSEIDGDALWADILPQVQRGNNRRRGIIWFFFIGLIASFTALYALSVAENSDSKGIITPLSSVDFIDEIQSNTPLIQKDNETIPSLNEEKNIIETTIQTVQVNNIQLSQKQPLAKTTINKNKQEKYKASTTYQTQTENSTSSERPVSTNKNDTEIIPIGGDLVLLSDSKDNNPETEETIAIIKEEAIPTDIKEPEIDSEVEIIENAEQKAESTLKTTADENAEATGNYNSRQKNFKLNYGFGLYGGYSSSFGSLKAKDELDSDYLQSRLLTEEQLETIRLGFEAIAQTKVGVYFKTGLQYSRIASKFSLNSQISQVDSVDGIQKIYINNNTMDTIFIYGPVPVTTTTTYNKVTYNYFNLVDIPVLLGYNYKSESNWSFGIEAGAMINVSTKTKGEILNQELSEEPIYNIKEDKLDWFKNNVGVSFTTSINVGYFLNENLMIYLAPTARWESVFSTDNNPIEQKHGDLGINIGARYFIGN